MKEEFKFMGRISIKKAILLGLASVLDEAIDWWGVTNSPYLYLKYSKVKKHSIANAVSDLLKTGYLEKKVKSDGQVVYRITSPGRIKIIYDIPLARFTSKKWDGVWRLVSFDVPEKKSGVRASLRRKLRELGFGMLQESLWVTPHDLGEKLEQFLEEENLKDFTIVWEGKRVFGENEKDLARKVWKLDDLHGKYLDFISKYELLEGKGEILKRYKEWEEEYFSLLAADPGLPRELLPDDWLFERACQLFKKLKDQI